MIQKSAAFIPGTGLILVASWGASVCSTSMQLESRVIPAKILSSGISYPATMVYVGIGEGLSLNSGFGVSFHQFPSSDLFTFY